ncbi:hypothetical protein PMAYCL1PPCAC_07152 [Pristionchus mayeri]|uniref:FHA domain-containing protein n=1 Tax=Pristionchus mayeri TaxID=1317129 RepID=A0AAN4ZFM1_9BILA|nr:hypothetical protein PMAYCL1PPCAC_07152 [Pristionchus mayeri]
MFRLVKEASRDIALCVLDSSHTNAKIGRDPKTCTVQLGTKAVAVSREHADLQWSSSGVTINDTSSFGTLVNGEKILKSSKLLKGGERVKIGQTEFILEKLEVEKSGPKAISPADQKKTSAKNSITSYFTKKNAALQEESQPAEVSIRKILATETPSESQKSEKASSQSTSRKPVRGGPQRVNPLFRLDEEEEPAVDNAKGTILAVETPSDSVPSPKVATSIPSSICAPTKQANYTMEKKMKISLFAKPSLRQRTQKPIQCRAVDDDVVEIEASGSPSIGAATSVLDDKFARPSFPHTRSQVTTNGSMSESSTPGTGNRNKSRNSSDEMKEVNASSIATQIMPPTRIPIAQRQKEPAGSASEPPRKKTKSIFAEHFKQQKKFENNKPREKSLLDEDDNGVLNIRYDYVAPKDIVGERAYSSIENLRKMEQMGREAMARLDQKYGWNDDVETQYPSVDELTSILCSSHSEKESRREEEQEEGEVERVGDETLDEEIKSQLVTFCDDLVVSQPSFHSLDSLNPSQGKGFKKFKKAKQGRFASQARVYSGIIGGSDLVDFRQIQM